MLKFSINRGNELNFTAGLGRQDELRVLEKLDRVDSLVPEDLTAFRNNIILSQEGDDASMSSKESDLDDEQICAYHVVFLKIKVFLSWS